MLAIQRESTTAPLSPWSTEELFDAVQALATEASLSSRFCFFIDGLDEYDGTDREMVDIIGRFETSTYFKFCLSSRPHAQFSKTYGYNPLRTLSVSSLTVEDIRLYVHDTLAKNEMFQTLSTQHPVRCKRLVDHIVKDANGVFLWVYLVVGRLLEGIEVNNDRMKDLERKLQSLPKELDQLFRHILDSVENDYHESQAHMFRVACAAAEPLDLMAYYFMDFEEADYALELPIQPWTPPEIAEKERVMTVRVNARCKGLLEVTTDGDPNVPHWRTQRVHVQPIHRTFRDFLFDKRIYVLMKERSAPNFDTYRSTCMAMLAELKVHEFDYDAYCYRFHLLDSLVYYARISEVDQGISPNDILDKVLEILPIFSQQLQSEIHKRHGKLSNQNDGGNYMQLLTPLSEIHFRLTQYTARRGLEEYPRLQIRTFGTSQTQLSHLLSKTIPSLLWNLESGTGTSWQSPRSGKTFLSATRILNIILDMGADPNSIWDRFLSYEFDWSDIFSARVNLNTIRLLLEFGATAPKGKTINARHTRFSPKYVKEIDKLLPGIRWELREPKQSTTQSLGDGTQRPSDHVLDVHGGTRRDHPSSSTPKARKKRLMMKKFTSVFRK
jgi:hypothetical protein